MTSLLHQPTIRVVAQDAKIKAAGIAFVTRGRKVLFVRRSNVGDFAGHWCFPGGKIEAGETPESAARREATEEVGSSGSDNKLWIINKTDNEDVEYTTFSNKIPETFDAKLNDEHTEAVWADLEHPPVPLHPGVEAVLPMLRTRVEGGAQDGLALDRATCRAYDADGRMHVQLSNISKANVCPYLGREIPDWQSLGLQPEKKYMLYRDPDELAKGLSTFNNLPLLSRHVPVDAEDHQPDLVVGSMGTDASFEAPYMRNSLVIWAKDAIDDVESDRKKELSSAYRYRADMTPGTTPDGTKYDGVMRDIVGNHVALVPRGRAGSDVVVGDSAHPTFKEIYAMSKKIAMTRAGAFLQGSLSMYLKPKLAQDASIDLAPVVKDITSKNFAEKKPAFLAAVRRVIEGKLAQDADAGDLEELANALEEVLPIEVVVAGGPAAVAGSGEPTDDLTKDDGELSDELDEPGNPDPGDDGEVLAFLAGKLSDEDLETIKAMLGGGSASVVAGDRAPANLGKDSNLKNLVTKTAMDSAVAAAVRDATARSSRVQSEIRDAERFVRPWIGDITIACDSAETVFRTALKSLGVKEADTLHESALKTVLGYQPKPGEVERRSAGRSPAYIAQDSAGKGLVGSRFKLDRITVG